MIKAMEKAAKVQLRSLKKCEDLGSKCFEAMKKALKKSNNWILQALQECPPAKVVVP
jgi:hypothetical protein